MAILTPAAVRSIRLALSTGGTTTAAALAREYGVHEGTIAAAAYGRTWRAVTDVPPLPAPMPTGRRPANARLTPGQVRAARRRWLNNEPLSAIATRYGVAESTIRSAVHGLSWTGLTGHVPIRARGGRLRVLSGDLLAAARQMRSQGATLAAIAGDLGMATSTVSRALSRRS